MILDKYNTCFYNIFKFKAFSLNVLIKYGWQGCLIAFCSQALIFLAEGEIL